MPFSVPLMPMTRDREIDISVEERQRFDANYVELFGYVSSRARLRWDLAERHGRAETARLLENLLARVVHGNAIGLKTQQLVHFGQLLVLGNRLGAEHHAQAALRAGASVEELLGVAETSLITGGVAAYSMGVEVIAAFDRPDDAACAVPKAT